MTNLLIFLIAFVIGFFGHRLLIALGLSPTLAVVILILAAVVILAVHYYRKTLSSLSNGDEE